MIFIPVNNETESCPHTSAFKTGNMCGNNCGGKVEITFHTMLVLTFLAFK